MTWLTDKNTKLNKKQDDIEKARFNKLRNEFNAITLKLEEVEILAEERKKTIDSLSAKLSRYKRNGNKN